MNVNDSAMLEAEAAADLDCPEYNNNTSLLIYQFNFWVEGVTQTLVAIPGFLGESLLFVFFYKDHVATRSVHRPRSRYRDKSVYYPVLCTSVSACILIIWKVSQFFHKCCFEI